MPDEITLSHRFEGQTLRWVLWSSLNRLPIFYWEVQEMQKIIDRQRIEAEARK